MEGTTDLMSEFLMLVVTGLAEEEAAAPTVVPATTAEVEAAEVAAFALVAIRVGGTETLFVDMTVVALVLLLPVGTSGVGVGLIFSKSAIAVSQREGTVVKN